MRRSAIGILCGVIACGGGAKGPGGDAGDGGAAGIGGAGGADTRPAADAAGADAGTGSADAARPGVDGGIDGGVPAGSGRWDGLAPLPVPRQEVGVAALRGLVYAIGGYLTSGGQPSALVHAYDPVSNGWSARRSLPLAVDHANVAAVGDRIYFLGPSAAGQVLEYDPDADAWRARRGHPGATARKASGVAVVGARIYVAGGQGAGPANVFAAYDTAADAWDMLPLLPAPRDHVQAAAVGGTVLVIGGRAPLTSRADAFDTVARTWSVRAPTMVPHAGGAAVAIGGAIVVMGGEGNPQPGTQGVYREVEAYDPARDAWRLLAPMRTPRHGIGAAVVDGRIYVPGGAVAQGFGPGGETVEALTP